MQYLQTQDTLKPVFPLPCRNTFVGMVMHRSRWDHLFKRTVLFYFFDIHHSFLCICTECLRMFLFKSSSSKGPALYADKVRNSENNRIVGTIGWLL
jgi:hypothetical protein